MEPLRVSDSVHVEWIDDEAVALDSTTSDVHYLNPTAAIVLALIQEHGYAAGLAEVRHLYGDEPQVREELPRLLEEMAEKGILVSGDGPIPETTSG